MLGVCKLYMIIIVYTFYNNRNMYFVQNTLTYVFLFAKYTRLKICNVCLSLFEHNESVCFFCWLKLEERKSKYPSTTFSLLEEKDRLT